MSEPFLVNSCGCHFRLNGVMRWCPLHGAAPELLALLKRAAPYIKTISRNDQGGYSEHDPCLYEEIQAAIAKAR